jgi:hypothetical protein
VSSWSRFPRAVSPPSGPHRTGRGNIPTPQGPCQESANRFTDSPQVAPFLWIARG